MVNGVSSANRLNPSVFFFSCRFLLERNKRREKRRIWCEWHSKSTRRLEPESLLHKQINLKHSAQPPDYKCEVDESCFSSRTEWCPYDCWQHTPMTKCLQDETAYTIFQFLLPANEVVDSHSHYLCFTEKWCCQQATQHFLPLQLVHMSHWALVLGHELANVHVSWMQSKKRMVSHRPQMCGYDLAAGFQDRLQRSGMHNRRVNVLKMCQVREPNLRYIFRT